MMNRSLETSKSILLCVRTQSVFSSLIRRSPMNILPTRQRYLVHIDRDRHAFYNRPKRNTSAAMIATPAATVRAIRQADSGFSPAALPVWPFKRKR